MLYIPGRTPHMCFSNDMYSKFGIPDFTLSPEVSQKCGTVLILTHLTWLNDLVPLLQRQVFMASVQHCHLCSIFLNHHRFGNSCPSIKYLTVEFLSYYFGVDRNLEHRRYIKRHFWSCRPLIFHSPLQHSSVSLSNKFMSTCVLVRCRHNLGYYGS